MPKKTPMKPGSALTALLALAAAGGCGRRVSAQSAAASEVLTAPYGDNRPCDDPTHVTLGHPVKRLASFRAAAHEAGISRLYRGIHFPMGNLAGQAQGECIGRPVLARLRTRNTT